MQGWRGAAQAGHDLGRAGGEELKRLGEDGRIGRQRAHAHHCAARAHCSLAAMIMMMGSGCVLRGCPVMRVRTRVVVRGRTMQLASRHLVMDRHDKTRLVKAWRGTATPGEAGGRREHAEQIGEGNDAPHPDPHRSCQSQQHSADMLRAAMVHTRVAN